MSILLDDRENHRRVPTCSSHHKFSLDFLNMKPCHDIHFSLQNARVKKQSRLGVQLLLYLRSNAPRYQQVDISASPSSRPSSPTTTSPATTSSPTTAPTSTSSTATTATASTTTQRPLMLIRPRTSLQPRLPFILRNIKRILNPQHLTEPTRLRIRILPQPPRIAFILRQAEIPAIVHRRRELEVFRDLQIERVGFDPGERLVD